MGERRLDGKVAVITGAGSGIGREAAMLFSEHGAKVCIADVDEVAGDAAASACHDAFFQPVDVGSDTSVAELYRVAADRYGGIDVLYNNAGIMPPDDASVLDTSVDAWDRVQAVNARGVFLCCKYGIPHLPRRRIGHQRCVVRGRHGRCDLADLTRHPKAPCWRCRVSWGWSSRAAACGSTRCVRARSRRPY